MAKKVDTTVTPEAVAMVAANSVVRQPVFIINNAPLLVDEPAESEVTHRGNTGWVIAIPALQIAVPAIDRNTQEPKCGFFDDDEAVAQAESIYRQCVEEPKVLAELQKKSVWPTSFVDGHKIMQRFISVRVA